MLLIVRGRLSWLLAGGLLAAEVAVRAAVTGLPLPTEWFGVLYVTTYYVDDGLALFGFIRLAQIVGDVQEARAQAADLVVVQERLQAAERLQEAVGQRLAAVADQVAAARGMLSRHPEEARDQIAAGGVIAREAVAQARTMAAGRGVPALAEPALPATSAVIAPRLAWAVLVTVLAGYAVQSVGSVIYFHYGVWLAALALTDIVLVTAIQLYHSGAAPAGGRACGS